MKEWVRQHPYLALVLGYAIFFVFTTAVWFAIGPHDLGDALITAFIWTLAPTGSLQFSNCDEEAKLRFASKNTAKSWLISVTRILRTVHSAASGIKGSLPPAAG